MTVIGCDLNWWRQHFSLFEKTGVKADEAPSPHLLFVAERTEIWVRWRRGKSMHDIGRLFDRGHSSIFQVLAPTGGIRPPPLCLM